MKKKIIFVLIFLLTVFLFNTYCFAAQDDLNSNVTYTSDGFICFTDKYNKTRKIPNFCNDDYPLDYGYIIHGTSYDDYINLYILSENSSFKLSRNRYAHCRYML